MFFPFVLLCLCFLLSGGGWNGCGDWLVWPLAWKRIAVTHIYMYITISSSFYLLSWMRVFYSFHPCFCLYVNRFVIIAHFTHMVFISLIIHWLCTPYFGIISSFQSYYVFVCVFKHVHSLSLFPHSYHLTEVFLYLKFCQLVKHKYINIYFNIYMSLVTMAFYYISLM